MNGMDCPVSKSKLGSAQNVARVKVRGFCFKVCFFDAYGGFIYRFGTIFLDILTKL